jgi:hypothetical protein
MNASILNISSSFSDFKSDSEEFALLTNSPFARGYSTNQPRNASASNRLRTTAILARVMLLSSHGASTLGKTLRRPIMSSMGSFEGSTTLASDAMRASNPSFRNGRAVYVLLICGLDYC